MMAAAATLEWQWVINQGIAVAVVVFVGFVLWRVLVGTEKTGYQGMLIKWAQGLSVRLSEHADEAADRGKQEQKEHATALTALHLLVESQSPPVGAAFIAAKAVHKTAADVEQLRKALHEFMGACRLIATQFPVVEAEINTHCDEIEKAIGSEA